MSDEEILRMWDIDSISQIGSTVPDEDKKWFNEHFDEMKQTMQEAADHWNYHTGKFKI